MFHDQEHQLEQYFPDDEYLRRFFDIDFEQEAYQKIITYSERMLDASSGAQQLLVDAQSCIQKVRNQEDIIIQELQTVSEPTKTFLFDRENLAVELQNLIGDVEKNSSIIYKKLTDFLLNDASHSLEEPIQKIQWGLRQHRNSFAKQNLLSLIEDLRSPKKQWEALLRLDDFPQDLVQNIPAIIESSTVRSVLQIIEKYRTTLSSQDLVAARAKIFQEFLQRGYSPTLILEIVEGRSDLSDPTWNESLIKSFVPVFEYLQDSQSLKRKGITTKIVLTGVIAILVGGSLLTGSVIQPSYQHAETIRVTAPLSQPNEEEDTPQEPQDAESPPSMDSEFSPENSEKLDKTVYWKIEGNVPDGYFRTATANNYRYAKWMLDVGNEQLLQASISSTPIETPTRLVSIFSVSHSGQLVNIPLPENWEIAYIQIGETSNYRAKLYHSFEGSYVIQIPDSIITEEKVTIGIKPRIKPSHLLDAPVTNNTYRETIDTYDLLGKPEKIDEETKNYLDSIRNDPTKTTKEKAASVTQYVQDHFIYSLEKKYSDFYLEDRSPGEYVERAWKVGYGDCDVVNTVNVAFLRYVGIDARLSVGFANSSSLLSIGRDTLEGSEMHGWAQFFNPDLNKWEDADATPGTVDPNSLEDLLNLNNGAGIENIFTVQGMKELIRSIGLLLAKTGEFFSSEWGILIKILSAIGLYSFVFGTGRSLEKKNEKILDSFTKGDKDKHPSWNPEKRMTDAVKQIVREFLFRKGNYLARWEVPIFDRILLLPRLIKTIQDRKTIQPLKKLLLEPDSMKVGLSAENVSSFVMHATGIDKQTIKTYSEQESRSEGLRSLVNDFKNSTTFIFSPEFTSKEIKHRFTLSRDKVLSLYKQNSRDVVAFIDAVFDSMYTQYLRAHAEIQKKQSRGKKITTISNTSLPILGRESIKMTAEPITREQFYRKFQHEMTYLVQYHDLSRTKNDSK